MPLSTDLRPHSNGHPYQRSPIGRGPLIALSFPHHPQCCTLVLCHSDVHILPFCSVRSHFTFISSQWSHLIVLHMLLLMCGLYNRALIGLAMPSAISLLSPYRVCDPHSFACTPSSSPSLRPSPHHCASLFTSASSIATTRCLLQ